MRHGPANVTTPRIARSLLLIEDNAADAELVRDLLSNTNTDAYEVVHVVQLSQAFECLRARPIDVIVLDLQLPDSSGVESVRRVRAAAGQIPIVVLTSNDDEEFALSCIDAGAQDYLPKSEVKAQNLRRAMGYALTRAREAQLRELQTLIDSYRSLSSAGQGTLVTAALAGSGALAQRNPAMFERMVLDYAEFLSACLAQGAREFAPPRSEMERFVTALGDANAGPRDLIDLHISALESISRTQDGSAPYSLVVDARLIALEMMGLLVDYYRVGQRRRFREGFESW